jgi:pSer/pThr/pTyr-binding forkhead associated (FHA) protein
VSEPVVRLIEQRQGRAGRVHELGLGTHVLGREARADVVLDHADVSRHHAELEVTFDGATIRDLDSKNGVAVEGRKIASAQLEDGSRLAFGELSLVLEHPGARVGRALQRGGEPTVRRPRSTISEPTPRPATERGLLAPLLAAMVFAVLLILLLVFG